MPTPVLYMYRVNTAGNVSCCCFGSGIYLYRTENGWVMSWYLSFEQSCDVAFRLFMWSRNRRQYVMGFVNTYVHYTILWHVIDQDAVCPPRNPRQTMSFLVPFSFLNDVSQTIGPKIPRHQGPSVMQGLTRNQVAKIIRRQLSRFTCHHFSYVLLPVSGYLHHLEPAEQQVLPGRGLCPGGHCTM